MAYQLRQLGMTLAKAKQQEEEEEMDQPRQERESFEIQPIWTRLCLLGLAGTCMVHTV